MANESDPIEDDETLIDDWEDDPEYSIPTPHPSEDSDEEL